jgi:hypothetical protein
MIKWYVELVTNIVLYEGVTLTEHYLKKIKKLKIKKKKKKKKRT